MLGFPVAQIAPWVAGVGQRIMPVMGQCEVSGTACAEFGDAGQVGADGGAFVVKPTVKVGLDGGKRVDLTCGISGTYYACSPDATAVAALAAALPRAQVLSATMTLTIPGMMALPPQERTLELTGTATAQARLLAAGAAGEALPSYPGLDIQGLLDRILRDLGFPNGAADALPKLMPLISWLWS